MILVPLTALADVDRSTEVKVGEVTRSEAENARASWDVSGTSGSGSTILGDARLSRVNLASGEAAACTKRIDFDAETRALVCTFNLALAVDLEGPEALQSFRLGSGFTASTSDEADAATFARLGVKPSGTGHGFMLVGPSGTRTADFEGTQAVTWALNVSDAPMTYAAPNGTFETIAAHRMDVWVGRDRAFDEMDVTNARVAASDLKWLWDQGAGQTTFSQLQVRALKASETAAVSPAAPDVASPVAEAGITDGVELYRPWPNPASSQVRYAYRIPSGAERVDIGIFDVSGRSIRNLVRGVQSTGRYEVVWDGRNETGTRVHGGVYFLRAAVGSGARVSRIVLID